MYFAGSNSQNLRVAQVGGSDDCPMLVLRREVGPLEILPGTAEHLAEVRQMDTDTARMEAIVDEAELRYDLTTPTVAAAAAPAKLRALPTACAAASTTEGRT